MPKPIEEAIRDALREDAQKNALDFVAFLTANGIATKASINYWNIQYKGESVCSLWIDGSAKKPGPWTIWSAQVPGAWATWTDGGPGAEYAVPPLDGRVKEAAWAHVNVCGHCGGCPHPGGRRKAVLGKEFDHLCDSTLAFTDPDAEALDCAKKMVAARINDILESL